MDKRTALIASVLDFALAFHNKQTYAEEAEYQNSYEDFKTKLSQFEEAIKQEVNYANSISKQ